MNLMVGLRQCWCVLVAVSVGVLVSIASLRGTDTVRAQDGDGASLINGSVELPYHGQGSMLLAAPDGWSVLVLRGAPEAFPVTGPVQDGDIAWKFTRANAPYRAAAYQRVERVAAGSRLRLQATSLAYACNADAATSCLPGEAPAARSDWASGITVRIGMDPAGGTDPAAEQVVWSAAASPYDQWSTLELAATAQAETVTVFLHVSQAVGLTHNGVLWDAVTLSVVDAAASDDPLPYPERVLQTEPAALRGYWPLAGSDDNASDRSANGSAGSANAIAWHAAAPGESGMVARFNGTDSFIEVDPAALGDVFPVSGSVMFWAAVDDVERWTDGQWNRFMSFMSTPENQMYISMHARAAGTVFCEYRAGGMGAFADVDTGQSTDWFHIAVTWEPGHLKLYYNGTLVDDTTTWPGPLAGPVQAIVIGATPGKGAGFFAGRMAHVAVWDRALSAHQLRGLATLPGATG